MRVIELIIDEEQEFSGIEAISIVDKPAIQEDFIALSKQDKVQLADVDTDKRILMGAALIPNKNIYRQDSEEEEGYYIYFSEETVKKASELFLIEGNQNKSTLEHKAELSGLSVVESWIIEDEVHDKSRKYGLEMPLGTWMVSMKVNNEDVWQDYVKTGAVKGFSIEGYFSEAVSLSVSEKTRISREENMSDLTEEEAQFVLSKLETIIANKLNELKS